MSQTLIVILTREQRADGDRRRLTIAVGQHNGADSITALTVLIKHPDTDRLVADFDSRVGLRRLNEHPRRRKYGGEWCKVSSSYRHVLRVNVVVGTWRALETWSGTTRCHRQQVSAAVANGSKNARARSTFFRERVVNVSNSLPSGLANFRSLSAFKR